MKDVDEAIGRVMAGLREAEAAPGLEERVERRVREAAARGQGASGWFGVWQWAGVGCVAMLLVGVGMNLRRHGKHDVMATSVGLGRDAREQAGRDGVGGVEEGVSQRLKPRAGTRDYGTAEAVPISRRISSSREAVPRLGQVSARAKDLRDVGSSGIAGEPGVGFPAPPLPLTEQERLLLRAAQGGDPVPVAVLEVSILPTHDGEETAAFQEFFGKPEEVSQTVQKVNQGESR